MAAESLAAALKGRFSDLELKGSIRSLHPFYRRLRDSPVELLTAGVTISDLEAFPYKTLRSVIRGLAWPSGFQPALDMAYDFPSDRELRWSDELNGVTHDSANWYFAQKDALWSFPIGHNLNDSVDVFSPPGFYARLPTTDERGESMAAYDHFGDIDLETEVIDGHVVGKLYVPLEDEVDEGETPEVAKLAIYNESLELVFTCSFPEQRSASWCAVNPGNGLLFSSEFEASALHVYHLAVVPNIGLVMNSLGDFELFDRNGHSLADLPVVRIQGGCFSPNGHLYLCSDASHGGVRGFDMITGREVRSFEIDYEPFELGFQKQELEGITVWPLSPGASPGIRGQIHLIMIDNAGSDPDDLYFKHFEVLVPGEEDLV